MTLARIGYRIWAGPRPSSGSAIRICIPTSPVRSLDAFPGNLPVQRTSFVGRDRELTLIADGLNSAPGRHPDRNGRGGQDAAGSARAAEVLAGYPDGVWLCELAAAADPSSMLQVVATSLGLARGSGDVTVWSIAEFVGSRRLLIVLDNCEHLLDAAAEPGGRRSWHGVRSRASSPPAEKRSTCRASRSSACGR